MHFSKKSSFQIGQNVSIIKGNQDVELEDVHITQLKVSMKQILWSTEAVLKEQVPPSPWS